MGQSDPLCVLLDDSVPYGLDFQKEHKLHHNGAKPGSVRHPWGIMVVLNGHHCCVVIWEDEVEIKDLWLDHMH